MKLFLCAGETSGDQRAAALLKELTVLRPGVQATAVGGPDFYHEIPVMVGTFNQIGTTALPCQHPELHVYAALTDGYGSYTAKLLMHHRDTGRAVFAVQGPITFADPKQVVELTFVLKRITLPEAGMYDIELLCDERHVIARSLTVLHIDAVDPERPRS